MSAATDLPPTAHDHLAAAYARWRATVEAELKGASFEKKLVTRTFEGIALQPLYTQSDLGGVANLDAPPGAAPYLRGARPLGYKTHRWEIAQSHAGSTPAEFNAALLTELMDGQNAVVLTPDRASRRGCDPDQAESVEVGAGGVSLADAKDISDALHGVELSAVPVHLAAGADATGLAALFLEAARQRGTGWASITGSLTADPLGEWAEGGNLPASLDSLYQSLAGWTAWVETYVPELRTIGVNAAFWGNAGGTATQELAFALATATDYLRELKRRDVPVKAAAARMVFRFSIGPQFFTEIAKFRAWRPLWTRVVTAFGVASEVATAATVQAATGQWNKTLLDPHVNMLRVTTEALSAVLGGCDGVQIAPFDEVTGATTDFSRRIARNVHTLLAEEFNFAETADAAGGSWYVEKLTDELARSAWALFQDIETRGGMAVALKNGYVQQLVEKAAAEKRDAVARRRLGLVGVNLFPNLKEVPLTPVAPNLAMRSNQRSQEISARRGPAPAAGAPAKDWATRFGVLLAAAREGATLGQLSASARPGDANDQSIVAVKTERAAAGFEALRAAAAAFAERTGTRPRVFLAKLGTAAQHKARADFSAGFFAVGGFEVLAKQSFTTPESAAEAAIASGARITVLCSSDDTYPTLVPAFGRALKTAAPEALFVLAGLPAEPAVAAQFRECGVDEFIHLRANVHDVLAALLTQIGVLA